MQALLHCGYAQYPIHSDMFKRTAKPPYVEDTLTIFFLNTHVCLYSKCLKKYLPVILEHEASSVITEEAKGMFPQKSCYFSNQQNSYIIFPS